MDQRRWLQAGGAGGLLFVGLFIVSISLSMGEPSLDAPASAWLAHYQASSRLPILGPYLGLYVGSFVLFMAGIYVKLRSAGERTRVPSVALIISAGATLAMLMASGAANEAAAVRVGHGLELSEAGTLADLATGFFVMSWLGLAAVLLAAGFGSLSSGVLPRWLGLAGVLIGAGYLVGSAVPLTVVWLVPTLSFYIWVAAVSVAIWRSASKISREPSARNLIGGANEEEARNKDPE